MINDTIQLIDLEKELKRSFISYAMAVIINRALPDVRDGLKPVHRRLLYSMVELGMTPDKPYRKSVRIVGDVLGKYHPHGDTAVYDTMVRLAQDFSMRYPLVDGQGNFGSVDGDEAAAMRYTEARMARITTEMITDIEKETVDFYPNFDETRMQPEVLPSRFPNLLVNGSGGIAVGMATNVPPHNLREVIDGVIHLIDHPDCTIEDLMQYIKGPDFPTGGLVLGMSGIHSAYRTGKGRIIMRAKADIEQLPNNKSQIIVTEIPYQVNKARLVEKIAELVQDKRVEGISDLRDESDRNGMRIVIELKQNVNGGIVLNTLYKHTQMQETFGAIMLVLVNGEPKILNLKEILYYYLEHQKDVIVRRTRYDLERALARAHILEGLLIALDNIDEVIKLIKTSANTAAAKEGLMTRFGMSEKQAQAVLDMRLARLTALERDRIMEEHAELMKQIEHFRLILENEFMVLDIIKEEILQIRQRYGDDRRTELTIMDGEIDLADLIDEEDIVVTMTHFGYVKRLTLDTYKAQKRGGRGVTGMSTREEDFVENLFMSTTHTDIMFFTNKGRVFMLKGYQIPEAGRTAKGTAIVNLLQLGGDEKVTTMIPVGMITKPQEMTEAQEPEAPDAVAETELETEAEGTEEVMESASGKYLLLATRNGLVKKTPLEQFKNIRTSGLIAIVLRPEDELIGVWLTDGSQEILIGTHHGMCIRFGEQDVRPTGRATQGVKSIELGEGDYVVDMCAVADDEPDAYVLAISENGYGKRTEPSEYRRQSRSGKGVRAMNLTDKTGALVAQRKVLSDEDIIAITDDGTIIRFATTDVSVVGRLTQGVRIMRVGGEARIVAIEVVPRQEDEDDLAEDTGEIIDAEE